MLPLEGALEGGTKDRLILPAGPPEPAIPRPSEPLWRPNDLSLGPGAGDLAPPMLLSVPLLGVEGLRGSLPRMFGVIDLLPLSGLWNWVRSPRLAGKERPPLGPVKEFVRSRVRPMIDAAPFLASADENPL